MAFDFSGLKELPGRIGDYLASGAGPVALGQGAQAVMEGDQDSWQAMLGKAGVDLGRSNIAANAAKKQAAERKQLAEMLGRALRGEAFSFTDPEQPGPTTASFKSSPKGQTFTLQGNEMMGPPQPGRGGANRTGPRVESGGVNTPMGGGMPASNQPTRAPAGGGMGRNMLPFFLAQAVTGSGGGGSDLRGLTPEQITPISRTDIAGQQALQQGADSIFSNMLRQAQADYYGRLPQKAATKQPLSFSEMKIDSNTGNWSYFDRVQNKMVDTGMKATDQELAGKGPKPTIQIDERVNPDGTRERIVLQDGVPVRSLGTFPEASIESARQQGLDAELAETERFIQSGDFTQTDVDNFNRRSSGNYYYITKTEDPWWGSPRDVAEKVQLPPGVMAKDMDDTLKAHPELNIDQVIQILNTQKR